MGVVTGLESKAASRSPACTAMDENPSWSSGGNGRGVGDAIAKSPAARCPRVRRRTVLWFEVTPTIADRQRWAMRQRTVGFPLQDAERGARLSGKEGVAHV